MKPEPKSLEKELESLVIFKELLELVEFKVKFEDVKLLEAP